MTRSDGAGVRGGSYIDERKLDIAIKLCEAILRGHGPEVMLRYDVDRAVDASIHGAEQLIKQCTKGGS